MQLVTAVVIHRYIVGRKTNGSNNASQSVLKKSFLNFGEVQSGLCGETIFRSDVGIGVGSLDAAGFFW